MKKTLLATLAAALVASAAVPALAAQSGDGPRRGPPIERLMERFDADRDGAVILEEVSAHRMAMFESADTDQSGTLSQDELKAFGEMRREMRDDRRDERRAERGGMRDGRMEQRGDRDGRMAGKQDGKRMGERRGEGRGGDRGGPRLERLDTNNDGEISLEEFAAMDAKLFERFDRNKDGKIDVTDFYRERADNN